MFMSDSGMAREWTLSDRCSTVGTSRLVSAVNEIVNLIHVQHRKLDLYMCFTVCLMVLGVFWSGRLKKSSKKGPPKSS